MVPVGFYCFRIIFWDLDFFSSPSMYAVEVQVPPLLAKFYEASFWLLVAACTTLSSYRTY